MRIKPQQKLSSFLLGLALLTPLSAQANNFSYNFFEARIGTSPGTFGAQGSTIFTENSHFVAKIDTEFDGDWDIAGGIGFNGPVNQFADIYGQILLHNIKDESSDKIGDTTMTEVNFGFRTWLLQKIEIGAQYGQLFDNDDAKDIGGIHVRFHSTDQMSVGLDVRFNGVYGGQMIMSARFNY